MPEQHSNDASRLPGDGNHRVLVRFVIALLTSALIALTVISLSTQRSIVRQTERSDLNTRIARLYQDARFWVGQEESLERKYRLEPSPAVRGLHDQAVGNVSAYLRRIRILDSSPSTHELIVRVLEANAQYAKATRSMFAAVLARNGPLIRYYDHVVTDPVFTTLERTVYGEASASSARALDTTDALESNESKASLHDIVGLSLVLVLMAVLSVVVYRARRAQGAMRAAELARLTELAITDPLTGLRNHRAFQEDLAQEMQRVARSGVPVSLVILDADELKAVNDTYGHQTGDALLKRLARTIELTPRGTDRAYRIGGDEFAIILHGIGAWAAFEFAQRLRTSLSSENDGRISVKASAGISQALRLRGKDELIREADLALMNAKRFAQAVVIYTPEMEPFEESSDEAKDEQQTRTLAKALALAVDAKDSYTRSHCQTVATLCAVIAAELGFKDAGLKRIRLAGLLHDVGKIGIPDSILKKPARLSESEFEEMKTHSVLGESIVNAAEMPLEAGWVRHHHERIDGAGYPDGLTDQEIPLEARIIHVADAFEAMTSDRPYRAAPGEQFAIEELRRHAGTQFDRDVVEALLRVLGRASAADGALELVGNEDVDRARSPYAIDAGGGD